MFGAMGVSSDGWIASSLPFAIPWLLISNKPKDRRVGLRDVAPLSRHVGR